MLPAMITSCFVVLALQIPGNLGQDAAGVKDERIADIISGINDVLEKAKSGILATELETGLAKCSQLVDQYLSAQDASIPGESIYDIIASMSPDDHTVVVSSVFDSDFIVIGNKIGMFLNMIDNLARSLDNQEDPTMTNVHLATLKFLMDSISRSLRTAERLYPYYLLTEEEAITNTKRSWEVKGSISTGSSGTKGSVSASKSWGRRSIVSLNRDRRQFQVGVGANYSPHGGWGFSANLSYKFG